MKELKEAWFEFKGVNSADMGVMLLSRPQRSQGDANGESVQVSGRSGSCRREKWTACWHG